MKWDEIRTRHCEADVTADSVQHAMDDVRNSLVLPRVVDIVESGRCHLAVEWED